MTKEEALKILRKDSLSNLVNYYSSEELQDAIDTIVSQPSLPSNLDTVAWEYFVKTYGIDNIAISEDIKRAVKFGAEWIAEQGYTQEEIVENKSIELGYGMLPGISPIINLPDSFKPGEKVIVQIRKK